MEVGRPSLYDPSYCEQIVELGKQGDTYDYQAGTISLNSDTQAYKALVKGQDKKNTNIDSSVAMYGSYVYFGDQAGIVQCVNINTMTPVWVVNMGDNRKITNVFLPICHFCVIHYCSYFL